MRTTPPSTRKAFSTLELVVAVSLFSLLLIALVTMILSFYDIYNSQQASISVGSAARAVMSEVEKSALQADHIVASHTFASGTYTTGTTAVVFELPAINSSGDIIAGAFDYVAVVASGTSAFSVTDGANGSARATGSRQLSTKTLSSLAFTYNNADVTQATKVDVDVLTEQQVKQNTLQAHLHQQIYLRNI